MAPEAVWRQEGESLVRDYEFEDFAGAMAFVNEVRLRLTTHSEGGLTENDHRMAARIDRL